MYPTIHLGFAAVRSFDIVRAIMVVVAYGVFIGEWEHRFGSTRRLYALGIGTFVIAGIAGLTGSIAWYSFRPRILHAAFGASPFWVQETTQWLFAGIVCCLCGAAMFLRGTDRSVAKGLDALAPSLAIAQVIYRVGCFLAGDGCYGAATDLPWGMAFPNGDVPVSVPVHPTMLYDAVLMLGVFGILCYFRRCLPPGAGIALFLTLASTVCFFIQFFMLNTELAVGLTEPQLWSLFVGPVAAGVLVVRLNTAEDVSLATSLP